MSNEFVNEWLNIRSDSQKLHCFFDDWVNENHVSERSASCDLDDYEQKVDSLISFLDIKNLDINQGEQLIDDFFNYLLGLSDPYVSDLIKNKKLKLI